MIAPTLLPHLSGDFFIYNINRISLPSSCPTIKFTIRESEVTILPHTHESVYRKVKERSAMETAFFMHIQFCKRFCKRITKNRFVKRFLDVFMAPQTGLEVGSQKVR